MDRNKSILSIRVKELRNKAKLTQEDLAKMLGLNNKSSIANYESGYSIPSDEIKKKMCNIFQCSMDYLMGLTSYLNPKEDLEKELYNLNLSEYEFNQAVQLLLKDCNDSTLPCNDTKISKAIHKCLDFIFNYGDDNSISVYANNKKLKDIIESLDKNKIIHRHNETTSLNENKYAKTNNSDDSISYKSNFYMLPVYGQISAGQPNWAEECIEGYLPIDPELMGILNPEEYFFLRVNGESMNKIIRNGAYALIHKQDTVENGEIAAVLVNGFEATLKKFMRHKDVIVLEPQSDDNSFQTQIYGADEEIKIIGKYSGKFEINK